MAKKDDTCKLCDALLAWDMGLPHNEDRCLGRQLLNLRKENKQLKASVKSWQDGWYEGRAIIGWLWWHHPAITNDVQRAYYQENLKQLAIKNCVNHSCGYCDDCENYMNETYEQVLQG